MKQHFVNMSQESLGTRSVKLGAQAKKPQMVLSSERAKESSVNKSSITGSISKRNFNNGRNHHGYKSNAKTYENARMVYQDILKSGSDAILDQRQVENLQLPDQLYSRKALQRKLTKDLKKFPFREVSEEEELLSNDMMKSISSRSSQKKYKQYLLISGQGGLINEEKDYGQSKGDSMPEINMSIMSR